jgi:hypothetical protein
MEATMKQANTFLSLLILSFLTAACGSLSLALEKQATPTAEPSITAGSTAPIDEPQPVGLIVESGEASAYWSVAEDPRTGIRFAVPCYWQILIPTPDQDPSRLGSFLVQNFTEAYTQQFPRGQGVFESGGIKVDFLYFEASHWGLTPGISLEQVAQRLAGGDESEFEIKASEPVIVNGQPALKVSDGRKGENGITGTYTLMAVSPELYFGFSPAPLGAHENADVQGIMQSLALSPEVEVQVPRFTPAAPLPGIEAACMKGAYAAASTEVQPSSLDCTVAPGTVAYAACNVQDAIRSGNTQPLASMMTDPFLIGFWRSEGLSLAPQEAFLQITNALLPEETQKLHFTIDRGQFPHLEGQPVEGIFGPDQEYALIVFSQGWGPEGNGEALLYFVQEPEGSFRWKALLIANQSFS